jgi:hypothetical protein
MNKVVARFTDGHMVKGVTADFVPAKDRFHVSEDVAAAGSRPTEVQTKDLKALFFVRNLAGNPQHTDRNEFDPAQPAVGRRIRVQFNDGGPRRHDPGLPDRSAGLLPGAGRLGLQHRTLLRGVGGSPGDLLRLILPGPAERPGEEPR